MNIFLFLILIISSNSLPHFIFDGVESYHKCQKGKEKILFNIYGSLTEKVDFSKIKIDDYYLEDIGFFKCFLSENENNSNPSRKNKIVCYIYGSFPMYGYILEEPKIHGFDFLDNNGKSTWPKDDQKKTFLIGECESKIELDDEPILLSSSSNVYSNIFNKITIYKVDFIIKNLPKRENTSLEQMYKEMLKAKTKHKLNEAESAYLVYKWIAKNIDYDCYNHFHGGKLVHDDKSTYSSGVGVCSGFSLLFKNMCRALGLEANYVHGYGKGRPGQRPEKANHGWNSVKIYHSYYLVDVTWGAGSCNEDEYQKKYTDFYFGTRPDEFIRTHLPSDKRWQLLSNIVTIKNFTNTLKLTPAYYENKFKAIIPDLSVYNMKGNGKGKITLLYSESSKDISISTKLIYVNGSESIKEPNGCLITKSKGNIQINFVTNKKGNYRLLIYVGKYEPLKSLVTEYLIKSDVDAKIPQSFPTDLGSIHTSEIELIGPLTSTLKKGKSYMFRLRAKQLKNMYIVDGSKKIKLINNSGLFIRKVNIEGKLGQVRIVQSNSTNETSSDDILFYQYKVSK